MIRKLGVSYVLVCLLWTACNVQAAVACDPKLIGVHVKNAAEDQRRAGIGDTLLLEIQNLPSWRATSQEELVLYVDGVPLRKAEMQRISDNVAEFRLVRDAADEAHREAWNRLLASPERFSRPVSIAVGPLNKPPWPSVSAPGGEETTHKVDLIILKPERLWSFVLGILALIATIVVLSKRSGILRDGQPDATTGLGTYSLARFQMAFWFVVVLASFLFLWIALGTADTFNETALGLLGISGGTGFISILLDRGKESAAAEAKGKALAEQAEVASAAQAAGGANPSPVQTLRLQETAAVIAEADAVLVTMPTRGFLIDLLSDENGVTLHRLQIFIWTVVLGGVFAVGVYRELAMPEFSATLLALMGLSSATYVGIKNTEK